MSNFNFDNEDDYKYCLSEMSSTNIGSRLSYKEILLNERVPFKFQQIVRIYILRELMLDNKTESEANELTLGEHFTAIRKDSLIYDVYQRLRIKVRFFEPAKNGGYKFKSLRLKNFIEYIEARGAVEDIFIQEINISNLALMAFSV